MGIKRYILLSVFYIFAVGLYVYSFNGDEYTLKVYTFSLTLPIAVWIVVPVFILFLASISHLIYYGFKDFFFKRSLKKDFDAFINSAKYSILGEDSNFKFKTEIFELPGKIIKTLNYNKKIDSDKIDNEDLKEYYKVVDDIRDGKYVDLKKYRVSPDNEIYIKNEINRLKEEPKYAYEVLKNCTDLDNELCKKAYWTLLDFAPFSDIKRYSFKIDKDMFRRMMERYLDDEDDFDMDIESIKSMLEQFNADSEDYLELAQEIKVKLAPDELIDIFRKLYNEKGQLAADAYLYILYDLQMIDKIREILENSDEEDFLKFKTLLFLRDHGKEINVEKFLRV